MELLLKRKFISAKACIGDMHVNGERCYYTLEDPERDVKIPGSTGIPCGRYEVCITYSNRFKREMLQVMDVPGFEGVRIHSGNTTEDTEGCILIGFIKNEKKEIIGDSKRAVDDLLNTVKRAIYHNEKIYLTIQTELENGRNTQTV